jgi:membrane protease YdiL (CAAX protease family)
MTAKASQLRSFRITVVTGWVLLGAAATYYARLKSYPSTIALPLALAFLFEYVFYLLPGFAAVRDQFVATGRVRAAGIFAASAVAPWMIYAVSLGHFKMPALVLLCCIALAMNFWYVVFPAHPVTDLIYLGLFAVIILFKVFARVYPIPLPKLDVSILGHVMLIRVAAFSILGLRGCPDVGYRFIPTGREALAGLRWFAMLIPVVGAAYWSLGLLRMREHPLGVPLAIGTFFGILWVVALSEEFLFRGLLQPWLEEWTSSPALAVILQAVLFGSVHLGFHGAFPNWRFSIAAAILGLFCGLARRQTGSIQAGMVAHALTVAVWKTFLQ